LIVNGDNVVAYGLKAEHTLGDLVQWNGEFGMTFMYQSELPYDVDADYGEKGFAGYRVHEDVKNHTGYGIGVYSFFRDHDVSTPSGIVTPSGDGIHFTNSFSVYLWGQEHSEIVHIINDQGETTKRDVQVKWLCEYPIPSQEIAFLQ
jgi:hypothetical protein